MNHSIVLFDGVCNLCAASVQWIIKHDKKSSFVFASLQSEVGLTYKKQFQISNSMDSVLLIENNTLYTESTAALRIARNCDGGWKLLYGFIVVPKIIRNAVYRYIAKKRYQWFGKKAECWLPTAELKKRFL